MAEYEKQTQEYVTSKWTKGCPMCGNRGWGVGDPFELSAFAPKAHTGISAVMPVIPVMCTSCSYVALIAGLPSGLVTPSP
jgi:hypothetical protein